MSDILIAAITLGGLGVAALATFLVSKAHGATGRLGAAGLVLNTLTDIVGTLVSAANQTAVDDLKKSAADGKITQKELMHALAAVKAKVIADAKTLMLGKLTSVFGWGEAEASKVIEKKVEAQVNVQNLTRNVATAAAAANVAVATQVAK